MALPDKARIALAVTLAGLTVVLFVFVSPAIAAGPPEGRITATVNHPITTYTAEVTDPDNNQLTYTWSAEIDCGTFRGSTPAPNKAEWEHPDGSPPSGCSHSSDDHPGTIKVVVADGTGYEVTCFYFGSAQKQSDPCVVSKTPGETSSPSSSRPSSGSPSPSQSTSSSPSPTESEGPRCERRGAEGMPVIIGTTGDDTLEGTREAELFCGLAGNDRIIGRGGNDVILGQGDNDFLTGGNGNDKIIGGLGDDFLKGEAGNDRLNGGGGRDVCKGGPGRDSISRSCEN